MKKEADRFVPYGARSPSSTPATNAISSVFISPLVVTTIYLGGWPLPTRSPTGPEGLPLPDMPSPEGQGSLLGLHPPTASEVQTRRGVEPPIRRGATPTLLPATSP
jgi:hypothetical protein